MDSTVQPERKETDATSILPVASRIGRIRTPPPMPQIEPAADAKKHTNIMITIVIKISFPNTSTATSIKKGDAIAIAYYVFYMDFFAFMELAISSISSRQASKNIR